MTPEESMRSLIIALSITTVALAGCYRSDANTQSRSSGLSPVQTCDDLLDAIHADANAKVDLQLQSIVEGYDVAWGRGSDPNVFAEDDLSPPTADSGSGEEGVPDGFSETNTQVAGVDEADIVKVGDEGRSLYVVRGTGFYKFDSWPASEISKVADVEIEGFPIEMFVHDDRAVVFSNAYDVVVGNENTVDCYYPAVGIEAIADSDEFFGCYRSFVKITEIDLSSDSPSVERELYVEGYYNSSRRHEDVVRAVTQTNLRQPKSVPEFWAHVYGDIYVYPESRDELVALAREWADVAKNAIALTSLDEWLPIWGERVDGEFQELPTSCGSFYVPDAGMTGYGLTQITGFDMTDESSDVSLSSILGAVGIIYASGDSLVLTQPDYSWNRRGDNTDRTAVHLFEIIEGEGRTPYLGSEFVEGYVQDQFSIDEYKGVLRLATTRTHWPAQDPMTDIWLPPETDNLVTTLEMTSSGLDEIGRTSPLAKDERIFSARFLGDLAYVVTFRQIDPLFAIDLSDAADPRVIGELKIPGFSDYMHPLGDDHLLTIGRDIDEETQRDNGTALQIFDISKPTEPRLAHKHLVGEGYSEANHNHKAFNYYAAKKMLAFPFVDYSAGFSSTLELYHVDATDGIRHAGSVDHSALVGDECSDPHNGIDEFFRECGYLPQVMRGVFIDDYIYSISHGGVLVHELVDFDSAVGSATYE